MEKDIAITSDGDLIFDEINKDLYFVDGDTYRVQIALCRIKSIKHDWFYDNIGANLEELIGQPITNNNIEICKSKIIEALTFDNFFSLEDIYIEFIEPKTIEDLNKISFVVYIRTLNENYSIAIPVELDLINLVYIPQVVINNDNNV